jgi:hypothetical protein
MEFDGRLFTLMRHLSPVPAVGRENFIAWLDGIIALSESPSGVPEEDFYDAKEQAKAIKHRLEGVTP